MPDERGNPDDLDRPAPRHARRGPTATPSRPDPRADLLRTAGGLPARAPRRRPACGSPIGAATPTRSSTPDGTAARRPARRARAPRRRRPRAPVALAHEGARLQRGGARASSADQRERGGRASAARRARAARRLPPSEAVVILRTPDGPTTTSRSSAASTSATAAATTSATSATPGRAARRRYGPTPAVARRPGRGPRTGGRRPRADVPRTLERPHAARPTGTPFGMDPRHPRPTARRARPAPPLEPDAAAGGTPRGPGAAHVPRQAARRTRSRRGASGASPARTHKAFARARRLVYVEDQYLWSDEVAGAARGGAARERPTCTSSSVVPRVPDRNGTFTGPDAPDRPARGAATTSREAGGDRVAVYDLENEAGTPIYVHAKVVVIDDVFAAVGSDNMNRRSWTHDSELSIAVLDEEHDDASRATRPASATAPAASPATCGCGCGASTSGSTADDGLLDPDRRLRRVAAFGGRPRRLARRRRRGPRPPGACARTGRVSCTRGRSGPPPVPDPHRPRRAPPEPEARASLLTSFPRCVAPPRPG